MYDVKQDAEEFLKYNYKTSSFSVDPISTTEAIAHLEFVEDPVIFKIQNDVLCIEQPELSTTTPATKDTLYQYLFERPIVRLGKNEQD